jgi:GT2 family glycosyltransferase
MSRLAAASSDGVEVVVVDNGSVDGTPEAVRRGWPGVQVVELGRNAGAVARNVGVRVARSEVVAFADDDSWWAPGSLDRACELFDAHPRLGLLAARVLVGPDERLDPVSAEMATSPLPAAADVPGTRVLGFIACGAVVRRTAFLDAGGFDDVVEFLGEEERVAIDLAAAGWGLAFVPEVVAHHHPETSDRGSDRHRRLATNWVLTACMRRPWRVVASRVVHSPARAVVRAVPRVPAALARRRRAPAAVETELRLLEKPGRPVGGGDRCVQGDKRVVTKAPSGRGRG